MLHPWFVWIPSIWTGSFLLTLFRSSIYWWMPLVLCCWRGFFFAFAGADFHDVAATVFHSISVSYCSSSSLPPRRSILSATRKLQTSLPPKDNDDIAVMKLWKSSFWCSKCGPANTFRLNIYLVVVLRDPKPACSFSKVCSAWPTKLLRTTHNTTLLRWLSFCSSGRVVCCLLSQELWTSEDQRRC